MLRLYSKGIGSKGFWPQLVCCAPLLSIAQYFRKLYVSYLKIQMAIVVYLKGLDDYCMISEGKDKYCMSIRNLCGYRMGVYRLV